MHAHKIVVCFCIVLRPLGREALHVFSGCVVPAFLSWF